MNPTITQSTRDTNICNFSKLIGKFFYGYIGNQYFENIEVTEIKYIKNDLCVILEEERFMKVEMFFNNFIQKAI